MNHRAPAMTWPYARPRATQATVHRDLTETAAAALISVCVSPWPLSLPPPQLWQRFRAQDVHSRQHVRWPLHEKCNRIPIHESTERTRHVGLLQHPSKIARRVGVRFPPRGLKLVNVRFTPILV